MAEEEAVCINQRRAHDVRDRKPCAERQERAHSTPVSGPPPFVLWNRRRNNQRQNSTSKQSKQHECRENGGQAYAIGHSDGWNDEGQRADRHSKQVDQSEAARSLEGSEQAQEQK